MYFYLVYYYFVRSMNLGVKCSIIVRNSVCIVVCKVILYNIMINILLNKCNVTSSTFIHTLLIVLQQ